MPNPQYLIQGGGRGLGLAFVARLLADDERAHAIASVRDPEKAVALRAIASEQGADRLRIVALDLTDEDSIEAARARIGHLTSRLDLMITCGGLLHDGSIGQWPEKKLTDIDPDNFAHAFAVNATGPALMIKHFRDLLNHGDRAVIAHLSARVGSISDNGLGGWYAYRASKTAQNQLTRTTAIELRRRAKHVICVGLHPGTVDTGLSKPFQRSVPDTQLQSADRAAAHLLDVIDGLNADDSGHVFDWAGKRIEP